MKKYISFLPKNLVYPFTVGGSNENHHDNFIFLFNYRFSFCYGINRHKHTGFIDMAKMKKKTVLILDCETTQHNHIFDVAFILVEQNAPHREIMRAAYILEDYCKEPLFSLNGVTGKENHFSSKSLARRTQGYRDMVKRGERQIISVAQFNAVLGVLCANHNPTFYAYNTKFDWQMLKNSGIRTDFFKVKKCLMIEAQQLLLPRISYKKTALAGGFFSAKNFMQFSAERVYSYILGYPIKEEHTAMEDVLIELEIYKYLKRQKKAVNYNLGVDWQGISLQDVYATVHGVTT